MIATTPAKLDWRGVPKMRAASLPHLFSIGPRLVGPTCVGAKNIKARTGPEQGLIEIKKPCASDVAFRANFGLTQCSE